MFEINKRTVFVSDGDYQIFIGRLLGLDFSVWEHDYEKRQLQIYNKKRFKKRKTDLFMPRAGIYVKLALKKLADLKKETVGWKLHLEDHGRNVVSSEHRRIEVLSLIPLIRFQNTGDMVLFKLQHGNPNTWEITDG